MYIQAGAELCQAQVKLGLAKQAFASNYSPRRESAYSAKIESKREQLRCDSEISVIQFYFKNYSWISIELSIHISFFLSLDK